MIDYVVAAIRPWNKEAFHRRTAQLPGRWHLIDSHEALTLDRLRDIGPRYVFFPHWSWKVPAEIFENFECIVFHMTDLPFGRGGSPLQNLIANGHQETQLSAFCMTAEFDGGPIYLKMPLALHGKAQEIFELAADRTYDMIEEIVDAEPVPVPQQGQATLFRRRSPEQSVLPTGASLAEIYDHIRMLDAEDYPHAFLDVGKYRLEFRDAAVSDDELSAHVVFRLK